MNYNQYLSVNQIGGYIYSKEIHTLTREIVLKRVREYPFRFFIKDPKSQGIYKDVKGYPLKSVATDSVREFKERVKQFHDYGHKVYGTNRLAYQYIYEDFEKDKINNKFVRALHFDIETARDDETGYSSADDAFNPVTAISAVLNGKAYFWCMKDLPSEFEVDGCSVEVFWFMTETEMLGHFMKFVRKNADILTGWNIESYDIPYTINRIARLGLESKKISPFDRIMGKEFRDKFGNITKGYSITGIEVLDYLNLYKKFTYITRDNYRLDTIAQVELGDKKVDYSEYKNLDELYENDFMKFARYSVKDSLITYRLEEKLKLIDLAITLAYKTGVNFEDTLGTVKIWTFYLYQEMMKTKTVPHMFAESKPTKNIVGGFVKEPIRGKHKWVMSFDLASLYPHNQMGMNISFDKLLDEDEVPEELMKLANDIWIKYPSVDKCIDAIAHQEIDLSALTKYNIGMTPNLQFYKNDSLGIIPSILKDVYNERKTVKKEMLQRKQEKIDAGNNKLDGEIARLNAVQMSLKILMNSEYGALGNEHFLFFDTRNAEAITSVGQVAIKFIAKKLNEFMNRILDSRDVDFVTAIDTDSVYLNFGPVVDKFFPEKSDEEITDLLDKIAKEKVQPYIDRSYHELAEYLNSFNMEWFMKREAIASTAVFVQKKRYFMNILDDEGVRMKEPKLKVTGLEAVRSSTPEVCRNALKKIMKTILEKDESDVQEEVEAFKQEFNKAHVLDVCFPRSVSDIEKWLSGTGRGYMKGTPIAVRGAIIFNRLMQEKDPTYETIKSGDKVKFIYLREPNKFKSNVIAFPNELPSTLGLKDKDVDRKLQFEKTFLHPVDLILNIIGWSSEKKNSLASFFG